MNQGRIWCVVNPTVGLPLFLGSVAVTSLIVHYTVLSNTTWFAGYWQGKAAKAASVEGATPVASTTQTSSGVVISVAPVTDKSGSGQAQFVITLGPKAATTASPVAEVGGATSGVSDTLAMAAPQAK